MFSKSLLPMSWQPRHRSKEKARTPLGIRTDLPMTAHQSFGYKMILLARNYMQALGATGKQAASKCARIF